MLVRRKLGMTEFEGQVTETMEEALKILFKSLIPLLLNISQYIKRE